MKVMREECEHSVAHMKKFEEVFGVVEKDTNNLFNRNEHRKDIGDQERRIAALEEVALLKGKVGIFPSACLIELMRSAFRLLPYVL